MQKTAYEVRISDWSSDVCSSDLFGAMDGAMKFVKGDAIAGLVIVVINLIGGFSVGMMQHDMGASESMHLYAVLTIGDGLIAQIPALLISLTAGMIIHRVSPDGQQIGRASCRESVCESAKRSVDGVA